MGRAAFYSTDLLSGAYVLVVDADKERRMLFTGILRYCGALVTPLETPENAFTVMRLLKPDGVVVDFSRPHHDAVSFIDAVRALEPDDGGTVSAVAIGEDEAQAEVARAHGFDAFFTRPLDPWALCRGVSDLLST